MPYTNDMPQQFNPREKRMMIWSTLFGGFIVFVIASVLYLSLDLEVARDWVIDLCTVAPQNHEALGIYANAGHSDKDPITVAIYNGRTRERAFGTGVGSVNFRQTAECGFFTHRINADSEQKAAELFEQLAQECVRNHRPIAYVAIVDHGRRGKQRFADGMVTDRLLSAIARYSDPNNPTTVWFLGCSVAENISGVEYLRLVADLYGVQCRASTTPTRHWRIWEHKLFPGSFPMDLGTEILVKPHARK